MINKQNASSRGLVFVQNFSSSGQVLWIQMNELVMYLNMRDLLFMFWHHAKKINDIVGFTRIFLGGTAKMNFPY